MRYLTPRLIGNQAFWTSALIESTLKLKVDCGDRTVHNRSCNLITSSAVISAQLGPNPSLPLGKPTHNQYCANRAGRVVVARSCLGHYTSISIPHVRAIQ